MEHNAGALRERVEVLELRKGPEGWAWETARTVWAGVELTGKSNLFSRVGIGARDALVLLRRQELTLRHALRWRGLHLFLTEITEPERGWLEAKAAVVELAACKADINAAKPGPAFPGVLTEKYVRFEHVEPMDRSVVCYVLVTPKAVELTAGYLAEVDGMKYHVQTAHTLDGYKNEFEIEQVGEH